MTVTAVSLDEEGVVRLILEFMDSRKLHKAMRSLEKDSGVVNCPYSDDVLFLRDLVLDGEWEAVLVFAQPFESIEAFDCRLFRYYVLKQKFMEVLYFKSGIGGGTTGYSIEDLIKCLNQLERDCPDKNEYSKLCWLLTVNNLSEQPEYRDWKPETARIKCFENVLDILKKVLPLNSKKGRSEIRKSCAAGTPVKERLVNLLVKGLCFENCVEYCQHRAINGDLGEEFLFPWRENLLTGLSHQASGNFLSWLMNLDQDAFTTAFEPMELSVELSRVTKPKDDVIKKSVRRDDAEILSRSLSLSGRPVTADIISQSVSLANKRNEALFNRPQSATGKLPNHIEFQHDMPRDTRRTQSHRGQTEMVSPVNAEHRNSVNDVVHEERGSPGLESKDANIYQLEQEQRQNLLRQLEEHEKSKAELRRQLMDFSPVEKVRLSSSVTQEGLNSHTEQRTENTTPSNDVHANTNSHSTHSTDHDAPLPQKRDDRTYHIDPYRPSPGQPIHQESQVFQEVCDDVDAQHTVVSTPLIHDGMTSTPLPKAKQRIKNCIDTTEESQAGNVAREASTPVSVPKPSGLWIALDDGSGVMNTSTPKSVKRRKSNTPCPPTSPIQSADGTSTQMPVFSSNLGTDQDTPKGFKPINGGHHSENKENSGQDIENPPQKRGPKVNGVHVRRALVQQPATKQKPFASGEGKHEGQVDSTDVDISKKSDQDGFSPRTGSAIDEKYANSMPSIGPTDPCSGQADTLEKQREFLHSAAEPQFHVVATLEDSQAIRAVSFHPGGELFAVGANSKILRVCSSSALNDQEKILSGDNETSQPTILFKRNRHHRGSIYCVAWNNAGDLIATGSNDKSIKVLRFDAANCTQAGPEVEINAHSGTVRDLTFVTKSSGSPVLVSGGAGDGNIVISDCSSGQTVGQLKGHAGHIMSLYAAGDGIIASGSADNTVRLWDLRSQRCIDVVATGDSCVASVCINTPGNLLASGHEDGACMIYDITAGRTLQFFKPHALDCRSVRFSPDSHFLLSGSYDASIIVMDLKQKLESTVPPHFTVGEHKDKVIQCRWHPHSLAFVSSSADRTAKLWALEYR